MCHDDSYEEFPAITVGGTTGNYIVTCPVTSGRWAEYAIDTIVNGDGGTSAVIVSADRQYTAALDYTGATTSKLNEDNTGVFTLSGATPYRIPATTTQQINSSWERIRNSERKVWLRIDAAASTSLYVTVRFRNKILTTVPGPSHEVHPDYMQEMNKARAETTKQRLKDMGIPAYAEEISGTKTNRQPSNSDERDTPAGSITR